MEREIKIKDSVNLKGFEELNVWKKSRTLCSKIYQLTRNNNFNRDYGLTDQIRRASVSTVSNIAEGHERQSDKEFIRFLYIAKGSCGEVRSQLYVALDLLYISEDEFTTMKNDCIEVSKMINGLIKYLESKTSKV